MIGYPFDLILLLIVSKISWARTKCKRPYTVLDVSYLAPDTHTSGPFHLLLLLPKMFFPQPAYPDHSDLTLNSVSEGLSLMTSLLWSTSSCLFHSIFHYLKYFSVYFCVCLPHQNGNEGEVLVCPAHCCIPIPRTAPGTQKCFSKYLVNEWTTGGAKCIHIRKLPLKGLSYLSNHKIS